MTLAAIMSPAKPKKCQSLHLISKLIITYFIFGFVFIKKYIPLHFICLPCFDPIIVFGQIKRKSDIDRLAKLAKFQSNNSGQNKIEMHFLSADLTFKKEN